MKVILLTSTVKVKNTAAAIGIFDGVHRGHQYLIKKMLAKARALNAQPIVITFFPHPVNVLRPEVKLGYLISLKRRLGFLSDLGIATCFLVRFNRSFAKTSPQKFIRDIFKSMRNNENMGIIFSQDF